MKARKTMIAVIVAAMTTLGTGSAFAGPDDLPIDPPSNGGGVCGGPICADLLPKDTGVNR